MQVHFESLALGGGSNAALPIWGLFMQKVVADGTLGISTSDMFDIPSDMNLDLSCTGGDEDENAGPADEDASFFD